MMTTDPQAPISVITEVNEKGQRADSRQRAIAVLWGAVAGLSGSLSLRRWRALRSRKAETEGKGKANKQRPNPIHDLIH